MPTLTALRTSPHFARLFAFVHVLCWPILWWNLCRFYRWCARENITDALYTINRWGSLTVVRLGDRHDPAAYKPLARTFRPLTDASWGNDMPVFAADLAACETLRLCQTSPAPAGEVAPKGPEGALTTTPNTS